MMEQLALELKKTPEGGPLFHSFAKYFDTLDTCVAIVNTDKLVLFLNQSIRERFKEINQDSDKFIMAPCAGIQGNCGLIHDCPLEESIKYNKIVTRCNVKSPLSDYMYNVTCMPLKYNGVSSVIEMWVRV